MEFWYSMRLIHKVLCTILSTRQIFSIHNYYYYLTQNISCANLPRKALIFLSPKQRERVRTLDSCLHLPGMQELPVWSQSFLLASPQVPSILWTIVSCLKDSLSSSINVSYHYVDPQSLVTKRHTRPRPQRTHVERRARNSGGPRWKHWWLHSTFIAVGGFESESTHWSMNANCGPNNPREAKAESPECISYCAGWKLMLSPIHQLKPLLLSFVLNMK